MLSSAVIATFVLLPLSLLVVVGKGDFLIAGYNTAGTKERAKCNIKRLRLLVSSLMLVVMIAFWLPYLAGGCGRGAVICTFAMVVVAVVVTLVLANSWAKKR